MHRFSLLGMILIPLGILCVGRPAGAAVVRTTAFGNGADTYLSNDGQSTNEGPDGTHGGNTTMLIRNFAGTRMKMAYVRFDLSGVSGGLDGAVLSFELLSTANRDRTFQIYGLTDDATDDAWNESTTSYNNAAGVIPNPPTALAQVDIDETKMTLLGTIGMNGSAAQVLRSDNGLADTSLNLDSFLAADTNGLVTFLIINSTSDSNASYSLTSKENTTAGVTFPTLELPNATLIPEPTAAALLGLMATGMLRHRRQHAR
jgi:hypothetical protein